MLPLAGTSETDVERALTLLLDAVALQTCDGVGELVRKYRLALGIAGPTKCATRLLQEGDSV